MPVHLDIVEGSVWQLTLVPAPGKTQCLLDRQTVALLSTTVEEAASGKSCRVLILKGSTDSFCEGLDLADASGLEPSEQREAMGHFADLLFNLRHMNAVVLCMVDGRCSGGGLGLACAADWSIATSRAAASLPELVLGLTPATILPLLRTRMSAQQIMQLVLSPTPFTAAEAFDVGIFDELVATPAEAESRAQRKVKHCLRCHPESVGRLKRLLLQEPRELRESLRDGAQLTLAALQEPALVRGRSRLKDGELPSWFERSSWGKSKRAAAGQTSRRELS